MSAGDHLSLPQFGESEKRLITQRSVWANDHNDQHVQRVLDSHARPAPDLYRGIAVSAHRTYLDPAKVNVGDRMHLPVSSFTDDHSTAVDFAHGDPDEHQHEYTPTMLHVTGGRGVPVHHVSNLPWEREWLSHGQFEVTGKGSDPDNDIDHVIHLRHL
jgi:hypothetical protein